MRSVRIRIGFPHFYTRLHVFAGWRRRPRFEEPLWLCGSCGHPCSWTWVLLRIRCPVAVSSLPCCPVSVLWPVCNVRFSRACSPLQVTARVLASIQSYDRVDASKVTPTSQFGDLGLDSLDQVRLLFACS